MSKNNLPPFYIGQRVVRIEHETDEILKKGECYTVSKIKYCCDKWQWKIELVGIAEHRGLCCECGNKNSFSWSAKNFAPIEENFEMISYKEVVRKEKPLTCAN